MAAGLGTRFGHYTELVPKGFVEVNGIPMIVRPIEILLSCGVERIIIGTGYKHEAYDELRKQYPAIETCYSPRYAETNSMYTLYNMRNVIGGDDFILLESDLVYEKKAITSLIDCPLPDVLLATPLTKFQDQYFVEYDEAYRLTNCSIHKDDLNVKGEFVGIHKLSNVFYKKMCEHYQCIVDAQPKLGYEYELLCMSHSVSPLYVLKVEDLKWYEIDDEEDLRFVEKSTELITK